MAIGALRVKPLTSSMLKEG